MLYRLKEKKEKEKGTKGGGRQKPASVVSNGQGGDWEQGQRANRSIQLSKGDSSCKKSRRGEPTKDQWKKKKRKKAALRQRRFEEVEKAGPPPNAESTSRRNVRGQATGVGGNESNAIGRQQTL